MFERMRDAVTYFPNPLDKGELGRVETIVSELLLEERISSEDYIDYIDRNHWFSFSIASFAAPSLDMEILKPIPEVEKEKERLLDGVEGKLDDAAMRKVSAAEKTLLNMAKEKLSENDGPGIRLYDSGAAGSFRNNYKNTAIMRGVMSRSSDKSERRLSKANLMQGISKEELHMYADLMVTASFSRSVLTQDAGYIVKQFHAAFGHIVLGEPESDCGTKHLLPVRLTKDNMMEYHLRWAWTKSGWRRMEKDALEKLVGRTVELRSPLFCVSERICNRCAGDLFYRLGTQHIASVFSKIGSQLLNASLKAFHDLSLKTVDLDVMGSFRKI